MMHFLDIEELFQISLKFFSPMSKRRIFINNYLLKTFTVVVTPLKHNYIDKSCLCFIYSWQNNLR